MRNVAGESQVRDGLRDETVIQLLRIVDFVAAGHAAGMKMSDPLKILLDVSTDVAVHDLRVIDVVQNFDARRIDAAANLNGPSQMVADLILSTEARVLELAVHHFHTDSDAFVFGARFDSIQKRYRVAGALGVRHPAALSAYGNDVGNSGSGTFIDGRAHGCEEFVVGLFVNHAVFHGDASHRRHGRDKTVFLERGPVFGTNQIVTHAAQLGSYPTAFFEGHLGIERKSRDTLFEASLGNAFGLSGGCSRGADEGSRGDKVSASHGWNYTNCPPGVKRIAIVGLQSRC